MRSKLIKIFLITLALLILAIPNEPLGRTENQVLAGDSETIQEPFLELLPEALSLPGRIEGTGTYFEIKDSEYLNISLQSAEEVKIVLESIPRMISINIETVSTTTLTDAASTNLTISGLEPNKTYYKYQNSYKNGDVFNSSEKGSFSWQQDLTQSHHLWIQEIKGTIFLPEDCSKYGIWNEETRTCALTQDLTKSVEITANNINLDCHDYKIIGSHYGGFGIYFNYKTDIAIKNCQISDFTYGLYSSHSSNNNLIGNTALNNFYGITLYFSARSKLVNNNILNQIYRGIYFHSSFDNILNNNIISNNCHGILLYGGLTYNNIINDNVILGNLVGIFSYYSYKNFLNKNIISDNNYGIVLTGSTEHEIIENVIRTNNVGIRLDCVGYFCSYLNRIYHNNFIDNQYQTENIQFNNFFDNGYPNGGNYWSDYVGIDEKSGENQDEPGSDGIGDSSYTFTGGKDNYPFMKENGWEAPSVPDEFWVEVKEDGECIYQEESLFTKLKCFSQGWILKVLNPEKKNWEEISPTTQIEDITDGISGWTNKNFLNYDPNKQNEWKKKTERLDPKKNPEEGGTVPTILESVNYYYNNVEGIPLDYSSFDKAFQEGKLEYGKTNDDIKHLQKILKIEIGEPFYPLDVGDTGYFGTTTKAALIEFQKKYDLDNKDGVVETATVNKLNESLNIYRINDSAFRSSNNSDNFLSLFKLTKFPIELILGIAAQESGGIQFNNEKVARTPWGRGIMQIDTDESVGKGSGIKWYKDGEINYCRGDEQACRHYYTNRPQGVYANIKDGLRNLQDKHVLVNKANLTSIMDTGCENIEEITTQELLWLSIVYRYNQGSPYCAQRTAKIWNCYQENKDWNECEKEIKEYIQTKWCLIKDEEKVKDYCQGELKDCLGKLVGGDPFYLKNIGEKLYNGIEIFFGKDYQNKIKNYCKQECSEDEVCKNKCENELLLTEEKIKNLGKKLTCANGNRIILELGSPVEVRIYDAEGRVTGLINGELQEEVPNSMYDEENKFLTIFFPLEFYRYEIKGIEEGEYSLGIVSIENDTIIDFGALNIPISTGTIHQYQIDWQKFSQGEKGVTLQIDVDGDGVFEKTVIADNDLTYDEFILQTETAIDFDPDTLNLKSKGNFVTVYIELPEGFDVNQIDISSILLNDSVPSLAKPTEINDYDRDGIADLMVKFERNKVQSILIPGETMMILTGRVLHDNKYLDFRGDDIIKVIK